MGMVCIPHWLGLTINGNIGDGLSHVRLKTWPIVWVLSLSLHRQLCGLVPHVWSIAVLLHSSSTLTNLKSDWSAGHPTKTTKTAWKTSSAFQLSVKAESWCIMDDFPTGRLGLSSPPSAIITGQGMSPIQSFLHVCVCPVHHSLNKSSGIRKL